LQSRVNSHKFELDQMNAALTHFTNLLIESIKKEEVKTEDSVPAGLQ